MKARMSRYHFLGIVFGIGLAALLLDGLFFERLAFAPANRTSWDSHPWYNFEDQYRRLLKQRKAVPADHDYVLVVGSSIAKYSIQKQELEAAFRKITANRGRGITVELFSHAAMLPTDLSFYVNRIRALRPDLVVYLTGPADLDLERYAPPYEIAGVGTPSRPGFDDRAARVFVANRHPMRVFYPRAFAQHARADLDLEQYLRLSFHHSFYALRFQDAWRDPFAFNLKAGLLKKTGKPIVSYLNYQGVSIPEGLWREGHTISQFSFSLREFRAAHRQAGAPAVSDDPELVRLEIPGLLAGVPDFHLKIFATPSMQSPGVPQTEPTRYDPSGRGWQNVPLPPALSSIDLTAATTDDVWITIQLSHVGASVVLPDASPVIAVRENVLLPAAKNSPGFPGFPEYPGEFQDLDSDRTQLTRRLTVGRGLRLPGNFGRKRLPVNQAYVRLPAWEDWRVQGMNEAQYRADFAGRIEPTDWREPQHLAFRQLNQIRLAKYFTNWYDFQPHIQQVQDLTRFARAVTAPDPEGDARAFGARLLIVNNPENPLTLAAYENNAWYRGYVEYMQGLTAATGAPDHTNNDIHFADHRRRLPMNRFLDTHHLTYGGLQEMAPLYAAGIARALKSDQPDPL